MNSTVGQIENIHPAGARRRRVRLAQAAFACAATIATLTLVGNAPADETVAASGQAHSVGVGPFAADDPSDPGYTPPVPAYVPPDPGYTPPPVNNQSQPDPGWNADPGWDFQPSP